MSGRRAICVSRDGGVRRVVDHALAGVGVAVEHRDRLPASSESAALIVVDRAVREHVGLVTSARPVPVVVHQIGRSTARITIVNANTITTGLESSRNHQWRWIATS